MCCHPDLFPQTHPSPEPWRFVLATAGGGSQAIGDFLRPGGQSDVLLEARSLQSRQAVSSFIGGQPDHYTSSETARSLAMASYQRARQLAGNNQVFGVGTTATLACPQGEREGREHKVYIALQTPTYTSTVEVILGAGRSRSEEEDVASRLIGVAIQWGLHRYADMQGHLGDQDHISIVNTVAEDSWVKLISSTLPEKSSKVDPKFLLSSSCNPLHMIHEDMARWTASRNNCDVWIELCVKNADKPPLDFTEIDRRVKQVEDQVVRVPCLGSFPILSNASLYSQKALLYPNCTFLVGTDTITRVNDIRFAGGSLTDLHNQFEFIRKQGCRFLVFPRFGTPFNLRQLDRKLRKLCRFVSERDGYIPSSLSSTYLRNHA